jgi:hypothetical protein
MDIFDASARDNVTYIKEVISQSPSDIHLTSYGRTLLMVAVDYNSLTTISFLLQAGLSVQLVSALELR